MKPAKSIRLRPDEWALLDRLVAEERRRVAAVNKEAAESVTISTVVSKLLAEAKAKLAGAYQPRTDGLLGDG